jgi:predicted short-subunit dehydrogenase-like oxidoreductase (DUF2520 family)
MDLTFAIIGPGSVGTVLARSLERAGFAISAVLGRDDNLNDLPESTTVVAICTPDRSVAHVANALTRVRSSWSGSIVFHVSGALTSEILDPLREAGAHTVSFHPLSSYPPASTGRDFNGTTIAIEGHPVAVESLTDVARTLGGVPVVLSSHQKSAYHVAASMASNFLVTLAYSVRSVLEADGLDQHLMDGLIADTVSNLESTTASEALTGPIARGDVETVRLHLQRLGKIAPDSLPLYKALAVATIKLAHEAGRINKTQFRSLQLVLDDAPL